MGYALSGKTALVTGANRGIGEAIADALVAAGVKKVYAAARNISTLDPLVDRHGSRVVPLQLDVTNAAQIASAAATATDVDLLVNKGEPMTHKDKGHFEIEDRGAVLIVRVDGGPHALFGLEIANQLEGKAFTPAEALANGAVDELVPQDKVVARAAELGEYFGSRLKGAGRRTLRI